MGLNPPRQRFLFLKQIFKIIHSHDPFDYRLFPPPLASASIKKPRSRQEAMALTALEVLHPYKMKDAPTRENGMSAEERGSIARPKLCVLFWEVWE